MQDFLWAGEVAVILRAQPPENSFLAPKLASQGLQNANFVLILENYLAVIRHVLDVVPVGFVWCAEDLGDLNNLVYIRVPLIKGLKGRTVLRGAATATTTLLLLFVNQCFQN